MLLTEPFYDSLSKYLNEISLCDFIMPYSSLNRFFNGGGEAFLSSIIEKHLIGYFDYTYSNVIEESKMTKKNTVHSLSSFRLGNDAIGLNIYDLRYVIEIKIDKDLSKDDIINIKKMLGDVGSSLVNTDFKITQLKENEIGRLGEVVL